MNASNAPQPAEQKCPNCGTMAPLDMALCPRCGMALNTSSKKIYGCATLLFQGFLALLALGLGASGACFTVVGWTGGPPDGWGIPSFWIFGVALLFAALLCIWGIIRIQKSRK